MSITVSLPWSRAKQKQVQSACVADDRTDSDPYVAQLQQIIALCESEPREAYRAHLLVGMEILEDKLSPVHCSMVAALQAECEQELASLQS